MGAGWAMITGAVTGVLSAVSIMYLQELIPKMRIHDTCGVLSVHGIPGLIGGFTSCIATRLASYGSDYEILKTIFTTMTEDSKKDLPGELRNQSMNQLYMILFTVFFSIITGLFTGFICSRIQDKDQGDGNLFVDHEFSDIKD
jgi:ammonium transporter Rh